MRYAVTAFLIVVVLAAGIELAGGQTAPSVRLLRGVDHGEYFSANSGFNVVGVEITGADGDGASAVVDLTDLTKVAIEGTSLVGDEAPVGAIDGANRDFATLNVVGDSGEGSDKQTDGFVDGADVAVTLDGAALPLTDYAILVQGPDGTVTLRLDAAPVVGSSVRFTYRTHVFDVQSPIATSVSRLVSASDGISALGLSAIDASQGHITLDGVPVAGSRNVVLEFEVLLAGRITGVAVGTETSRSAGEPRSYAIDETSQGSGVYTIDVGLVTREDLDVLRGELTAPSQTVGEILTDPDVTAAEGLRARLEGLRDELGMTDGDSALDLVQRLVPVSHSDTFFAGYSSNVGSGSQTAVVDLAPPTLRVQSPSDGGYASDGNVTLVVVATDSDVGVDVSGLGTVDATAVLKVDGTTLGDGPGELWVDEDGVGPATFTAFVSAPNRQMAWHMEVMDRVGNRSPASAEGGADVPFTFTVDSEAPTLRGASTGLFYDVTLVSEVGPDASAVRVEFDVGLVATAGGSASGAPLNPGTVSAGDFIVDGETPLAAVAAGSYVYLRTADTRTDDTPTVEFVGSVADMAGNLVDSGATVVADDTTGPAVTFDVESDRQRTNGPLRITAEASEPLGGAPLFSIQNGSIITGPAQDRPEAWSITVAGIADGPVIVAVEARDSAGNLMRQTGEDVSAQVDGVQRTFSVSERLAVGERGEVTLTVDHDPANGPGPAPIETATPSAIPSHVISLDGPAVSPAQGDTVVATYAFAESMTFEWDTTPPTAVLDPPTSGTPPTATVVEGSLWLRLDYNEPVSLSFGSLDSSVRTNEFFSADGEIYVLVVNDLAVGTHTLSALAIDEAGNVGPTQNFTIEALPGPTFDLLIKPGWNLISLPAPAVTPSVQTLFRGADGVEAIVGFDPDLGLLTSISTFGAWSGDVTELREGQAYWVHSTAFETVRVTLGSTDLPPFATTQVLGEGANYIGIVARDLGSLIVGEALEPIPVDDYPSSVSGNWERIIRFDPDPALGFDVLTPSSPGWNGVDPAGPDGELGFGPDGREGTEDDVAAEKADNVPEATRELEPARGYIVVMEKSDDLFR